MKAHSNIKEDWLNNIIAGNALEETYAAWIDLPRNTTGYFSPDKSVRSSKTRPDFVTVSTDIYNGTSTVFPNGTFFEVKASQNSIDLTTSNKQIHAQLNALSKEYGIRGLAGPVKGTTINALNYILVLPSGGYISRTVKDEATRLGIKLWVTYAYQNKTDNSIVFSNPELLNKEILKVIGQKDRQIVQSYVNGKNTSEGVNIDYSKAKRGYKDSNELEESYNNEETP